VGKPLNFQRSTLNVQVVWQTLSHPAHLPLQQERRIKPLVVFIFFMPFLRFPSSSPSGCLCIFRQHKRSSP